MNPHQKPGLYVHCPFCMKKCPYCDFYSVASTSLASRWLDALKKEVIYYRDRFKCFDTLYLGGGTPTVLDARALEKLMEHLFAHFDFDPDSEITIEANPGDLSGDKVNRIKALGFNRINLGVQSFDDRELLFLGRRHTARDAEQTLKKLRSSGFENVGVDLIYGLGGQSLKGWIETLKRTVEFRPEHLSCYQLTIEKETPFWRMKEKGMIELLDEEEGRAFFLTTSRFLEECGYIHYEISNFAREKAYCSHHNWKYWRHVPYLGLGPSAHSFQNSTRWWNFRSIEKYCEALEDRKAPVEDRESLTEEQMRIESIALGLRTSEGFDLKSHCDGPELTDTLSCLQESGFLRISNNRVLPTKKGFLVADRLPLYFLPKSLGNGGRG